MLLGLVKGMSSLLHHTIIAYVLPLPIWEVWKNMNSSGAEWRWCDLIEFEWRNHRALRNWGYNVALKYAQGDPSSVYTVSGGGGPSPVAFTLRSHPNWYSLLIQHFMNDVHTLESIPELVVISIIQETREQNLGELADGAGVVGFLRKLWRKAVVILNY